MNARRIAGLVLVLALIAQVASSAVVATRVTVQNAAATAIAAATTVPSPVVVRNRGAVAVYLGASNVTAATGFQLDAGESISLTLPIGDTLYGITAAVPAVVHVLRTR